MFENKDFSPLSNGQLSGKLTIGLKNPDLSRSVFLILQSGECAPCLKELDWWNKHSGELKHTNVSLIVIEKYTSTFRSFIKEEGFSITAYQDSSGQVLEKSLIPTTPIKIYFNNTSKIVAIDRIGEKGDFRTFLKKVQQK